MGEDRKLGMGGGRGAFRGASARGRGIAPPQEVGGVAAAPRERATRPTARPTSTTQPPTSYHASLIRGFFLCRRGGEGGGGPVGGGEGGHRQWV